MATTNVDHIKSRRTTVALKVAMALTGLLFVFFLLAHMFGNLKMFAGAHAFNGYAAFLREVGYPAVPHEGVLWIFRIVLFLSIIIHVYAAMTLWGRANRARGKAYKVNTGRKVTAIHSYTASLMRWGGIGLFLFIIFHILQFTTLTVQVGGNYKEMTPYARMVAAFQPANWWLYLIYLVAMLCLAWHIQHGVWSALVTLGTSRTSRQRVYKTIAVLVALAVVVGFLAAPTAIMVGYLS
ncbi:succinate dehydrogenase cytochrome b subunit [Trueperella sp. LYQ143]|uniref:succinate dehydrogenase cytochrome b subunit n=1 Tax=unclassified Trueperella TaxID=2630174 RepID=UPI003983B196